MAKLGQKKNWKIFTYKSDGEMNERTGKNRCKKLEFDVKNWKIDGKNWKIDGKNWKIGGKNWNIDVKNWKKVEN